LKSIDPTARDCYLLEIEGVELGPVIPGQFVHLRVLPATDPFLRRPFSVHSYNTGNRLLSLLFQERGKATGILKELKPGTAIDVMGPLGNGFTLNGVARALLVGGGIGIAPLYYLGRRLREAGVETRMLAGGATSLDLPAENYKPHPEVQILWSTEDGSRGYRGTVVAMLKEHLLKNPREETADMIYSCGPTAMLSEVVKTASNHRIPVEVSLEAVFACGVGACLGCVHPVNAREGTRYLRVCKEGPVFNGKEVIFDA